MKRYFIITSLRLIILTCACMLHFQSIQNHPATSVMGTVQYIRAKNKPFGEMLALYVGGYLGTYLGRAAAAKYMGKTEERDLLTEERAAHLGGLYMIAVFHYLS